MKCETCGNEMKEDDLFCSSCGASSPQDEGVPEGQNEATPKEDESVSEESQEPMLSDEEEQPAKKEDAFSAFKGPLDKKKIKLIGIIAAAAVVVIVGICVLINNANSVPLDVVKQDVMQSALISQGVIPSNYVNGTPYELADLKIDKQVDEDMNVPGIKKAKLVTLSGKIKNASFESTFTSEWYYAKHGDSWQAFSTPAPSVKSTTPLKGVDNAGMLTNPSDNIAISDFSSTFDQVDGGYASEASEKINTSYWFLDDTSVRKQAFVFDNTNGWKKSGEVKADTPKTNYKLAGKVFSAKDSPGISSLGLAEYVVTFKDVGDAGDVTADYTINYTPPVAGATFYPASSLRAINVSATATGKIVHKMDSSSFELQLNDPTNKVTLTCS
ncbi:MAG: zinc ribbon domain-containing protein, partial [Christensenella sp.]